MASPYLGSITMFAGTFAPRGYAFCDGSVLQVSQNAALYQLLGQTYGGNGLTTFALPDLRGRAPMHSGQGTGLSSYVPGQQSGAETVPLTVSQMPGHSHSLSVYSTNATASDPLNALPAKSRVSTLYGAGSPTATLGNTTVSTTGSGTGHNNRQPSLGINYIIATAGAYPPQS